MAVSISVADNAVNRIDKNVEFLVGMLLSRLQLVDSLSICAACSAWVPISDWIAFSILVNRSSGVMPLVYTN